MKVTELAIPGVLLIEPQVFRDERGFFLEFWQQQRYAEAGVSERFVQDNLSSSRRGTLRGLHLQHPGAQGKLVFVPRGRVFDVAVDVRVGSPTFGKWVAAELSDENLHQLYVPEGCAHGFCVLSEDALFGYKCTEYYAPKQELSIAYDDPDLGIDWPLQEVTLSNKDRAGLPLRDVLPAQLPQYHG